MEQEQNVEECNGKHEQVHACESCHCEKDPVEKKKKKKDGKAELKEQLVLAQEEVLRAKADLVNYRKRKDEEVLRYLKYANEDLVKEILPTLDDFERAIAMDDDNLDDEVSKFLTGIKMVHGNLKKTLEGYGVKEIDDINKPFDATYHQAVMTEAKEGVEAGIVIEMMQKGYLLKDKVIRPAMVKVSE